MRTSRIACLFLSALSISGCVTNEIKPGDSVGMAVLVPGETYRSSHSDSNSSMISEIDGASFYSLAGTARLVQPGQHTVKTYTCFGSSTGCQTRTYNFVAIAGKTYTFKTPQRIEVTNTLDKSPVDTLTLSSSNGRFLGAAESSREQKSRTDADREAQETAMRQRLNNLPLVRKIGARICNTRGTAREQIVYVGYVERLADEKVQIRISEAYFKGAPILSPSGFEPKIIWDFPTNWDLCE